MHATMC